MNSQTKIILFSLILLISIINKQCNSVSSYSSDNNYSNTVNTDYASPKEINQDYNSSSGTNTSSNSYVPTSRPQNGFSPYDEYCGRGIYNNSTDNTIKVTAPLQADIVIFIKDVYTNKKIRNEYIRAGSVFSLTGIPYGSYKFVYTYGNDWSSEAPFKGGAAYGNFLKDKGVSKSNKSIDVEFERGYYGTYSLTLQLLSNGNLTTVSADESDI